MLGKLRPGEGSDPDVGSCVSLLSAVTKPRLKHCKAQALANITHSIATLAGTGGRYDEHFFKQLLVAARPKLSTFKPQELSTTLLAVAKLGHHDTEFVDQLLASATAALPTFDPQALSNTLYVLAKLRHHCPGFTTDLLSEARRKLPGFSPQGLANLAYALASLNHQDVGFIELLLPHVYDVAPHMTQQGVANTLHALCILDHDAAAAVTPMLSASFDSLLSPGKAPNVKHLPQAYQYLVTMEGAGHISEQHTVDPRYQQLRDTSQHAWQAQLANSPQASSTQQQMLLAVRLLPSCASALSEHMTEDGLLCIDVAMHLSCGTKVAMEVLGPTEVMSNAPTVLTGPRVWRNRMLEARGWVVVGVRAADWDWPGVVDAAEHEREVLLKCFQLAGVNLPE